MIVNSLQGMEEYISKISGLQEALDYVRSGKRPESGRYEFPGGYIMFQSGATKPADDGTYEAHDQYLDLQILVSGSETILWNHSSNMQECAPYDAQKDRRSYTGEGAALQMRPGMCCLLFPTDTHKACRHLDVPAEYQKYVAKLAIKQ